MGTTRARVWVARHPLGPMASSSATDKAEALLKQQVASNASNTARKEASKVTDWLKEGPFALKALAFLVCAASVVVSVLNILGNLLNPFKLVICVYAGFFALIGMVLEVKPVMCTRRCKTSIEFWAKMLSRVWGRSLFYMLVAAMQLSQGSILSYVCAGGLVIVSGLSMIVSRAAANKLKGLHRVLIKTAGEQDEAKIRAKFNELDRDKSGSLDASELAVLASSLGADFTRDEISAVFEVLDRDSSGKIDYEEFTAWWRGDREGAYTCV